MPTFSVTDQPVRICDGAAASVTITNTGSYSLDVWTAPVDVPSGSGHLAAQATAPRVRVRPRSAAVVATSMASDVEGMPARARSVWAVQVGAATSCSTVESGVSSADRGAPGTGVVTLDDLDQVVKSTYAPLVARGFDDPADYGLIACNIPPLFMGGGSTVLPAGGTIYGSRVRLTRAASVTNLHLHVGTAGATLTAGQCLAALFGANKALIAVTADCSTDWASTGYKTHALTGGPFTVPAGDVFVAFFANGTTRPAFLRGPALGVVNGQLPAADSLAFSGESGRTTSMPATLATFAASVQGYWVGLS